VTAYIDRVRRLAAGQPSLRVRPRSRFEPAPPDAEPPWERTLPDDTWSSSEIDSEAAGHPARPQGDAPLIAGTVGRPPASAVPPDHPDARAARPWPGLRPQHSSGSSHASPAPAVPEDFSGLAAGRRQRVSDRPAAGPEEPPTVVGSASTVRPISAGHTVAASGRAHPALPAMAGHLSDRDKHRPVRPEGPGPQSGPADRTSRPTGYVPEGASSRPASTGSTPDDRSDAGLAVPAARGRRFAVSQEPNGRADPHETAPPMAQAAATAPQPRPDPAEAAGPARSRFPLRAGRIALAELTADDPAMASRPAGPDIGRRTAAEARPDEVTVTIGRVEVRVGPPPPAGAAAGVGGAGGGRPARAQPSRLQDYLRARAAGRVG
jgi:hypothetical protein